MSALPIPFLDLRPADDVEQIRCAIDRVIERGWFILGPEVEAFEEEFAAASGARYAVGVGNGTDAIALLLRAAGIGTGDEVIVPALTAAFTGLAVLAAGARPVFADVDPERLTLDPAACLAVITARTRAIVPVHLYGQPADLSSLLAIARQHDLAVVEDCCQAHLATSAGVPVGTRGVGGAFSFYPTKNLGALGDGGAIITNDSAIADRVRRLRHGGQASRDEHVEAGANSRLDEIQAAVLRARLPLLPHRTARRRALAAAYRDRLPAELPAVPERDAGHVYHLFPVRSPRRDALREHLRGAGIETLIHYPVPLNEQRAFTPLAPADCPAAARAAREVLSLPFHPRLTDAEAARVADVVAAFEKGRVPA
ncbi:MAG TPA: DegT/DnrJ/EryC1/StrS family aminotransferase [Vicinamibacterales bacterium]